MGHPIEEIVEITTLVETVLWTALRAVPFLESSQRIYAIVIRSIHISLEVKFSSPVNITSVCYPERLTSKMNGPSPGTYQVCPSCLYCTVEKNNAPRSALL